MPLPVNYTTMISVSGLIMSWKGDFWTEQGFLMSQL